MTDRATLLAERLTGVGASDAAHLFSLEPYGCARRLWYEKTETPPDFAPVTTPAMERGTRLEPVIREMYREQTGRETRSGLLHRLYTDAWLLAHLDGDVYDPARADMPSPENRAGKSGWGVLELKCPGLREFARVKAHGLPDAWTLQLQHQLLVTGRTWGSVAVLNAERWELLTVDVEADAEIQRRIREAAGWLWGLVLQARNGLAVTPPDRLPPSDPRCRKCPWRTTCQGAALLDAVFIEQGRCGDTPGDLPEDETLLPLVTDYLDARRLVAEAEEIKKEAHDRLAGAVGNRVGVACSAARVHYRPSEQSKLDMAAVQKYLATVLGAEAKQFERTSVVRSLKVIPNPPTLLLP